MLVPNEMNEKKKKKKDEFYYKNATGHSQFTQKQLLVVL
jgi:hypothetical protein